jgi:hypothetical protein
VQCASWLAGQAEAPPRVSPSSCVYLSACCRAASASSSRRRICRASPNVDTATSAIHAAVGFKKYVTSNAAMTAIPVDIRTMPPLLRVRQRAIRAPWAAKARWMAAKSWPHDTLAGEPAFVRGIISQRLTRHFGTQKIAHEQEKLLTALVLVAATASGVPNLRIEHVEMSDRMPTQCRPVHFGARTFHTLRSNGIVTAPFHSFASSSSRPTRRGCRATR